MVNSVVVVGRVTQAPWDQIERYGENTVRFILTIEGSPRFPAISFAVDITDPKIQKLALDHVKTQTLVGVQGQIVGSLPNEGTVRILASNLRLLGNKETQQVEA